MRVTVRHLSLLFAALSLAFSWAHLMEIGPRLSWSPDLWIRATVTGGLYAEFGRIGAFVEILALVVLLANLWPQRQKPSSAFGLLAFGFFAAGFGTWLAGVLPMNGILATWVDTWQPGDVPPDFFEVSRRWEFSHGAIAVLKLLGFGLLLSSSNEIIRNRVEAKVESRR